MPRHISSLELRAACQETARLMSGGAPTPVRQGPSASPAMERAFRDIDESIGRAYRRASLAEAARFAAIGHPVTLDDGIAIDRETVGDRPLLTATWPDGSGIAHENVSGLCTAIETERRRRAGAQA
jgi:hypothetical protein